MTIKEKNYFIKFNVDFINSKLNKKRIVKNSKLYEKENWKILAKGVDNILAFISWALEIYYNNIL